LREIIAFYIPDGNGSSMASLLRGINLLFAQQPPQIEIHANIWMVVLIITL